MPHRDENDDTDHWNQTLILFLGTLVAGNEANDSEFQRWHNGGGICHKSAIVDPTAVVEFGAVVHREAVVGPLSHIGSGAIVGPSVTVGRSTKLWYCLNPHISRVSYVLRLCGFLFFFHRYNVSLSNCVVGDLCVIHNGVCIGQDGKITNIYKLGTYIDAAYE